MSKNNREEDTGRNVTGTSFRALKNDVGSKEDDFSVEEEDDVIPLEQRRSERTANRKEEDLFTVGKASSVKDVESTVSCTGTLSAPQKVPDKIESVALSTSAATADPHLQLASTVQRGRQDKETSESTVADIGAAVEDKKSEQIPLKRTRVVSLATGKERNKEPKRNSNSRSHDEEHKLGNPNLEEMSMKLSDKEDTRVEFYVLIHPEWDFDPSNGHSVGIRFQHCWLGEWKMTPVTMQAKERANNGYIKLQGVLQLPPTLNSIALPYKYIVKCKLESYTFEYIKPPTHSESKTVNRVLEIPKHVQDGAKGRCVYQLFS
jgi:hypothetical protein